MLECPENVGLTIWSSCEKGLLDIASLLVGETKRYANRDKNKPEFKVRLSLFKNICVICFIGSLLKMIKKKIFSVFYSQGI